MLGTISFEPYFKSYRCFTVGSLEFLEIANQSRFFHLLPACLLYSSGRRRCAAPPAALGRPEATSCSRWPPMRRARAAAALLPLTLELPRSATHPEPPADRHLAAVMAGSLQHPRTPTRACTSTQSTTSFYSTLSFTASSPLDSRTPPASPLPPQSRVSPWSHHPSHP